MVKFCWTLCYHPWSGRLGKKLDTLSLLGTELMLGILLGGSFILAVPYLLRDF